MSIGISEVVLLCVVFVGSLAISVVGRNWCHLGMTPLFVIAMLVTPADPLSCLLVGLPMILVYGFAVRQVQSGDSSSGD